MNIPTLVLIVALLLANGVFVAFEFALVASKRTRLESLQTFGGARGRAAVTALGQLSRQMAGVQLGVTVASLGLGAVAEPAFGGVLEHWLEAPLGESWSKAIGVALGLTIVTLAHSVLGELVPRSLAMSSAERALLILALPLQAFVWIMTPAISVLNAIAGGFLRLAGIERRDELASVRSIDEIGVLVDQAAGEGFLADTAHQRLTGALGISVRTVESIMVPRDKIRSVRRSMSVADAEQRFVSYGFSRLPVIGRDLDDMLGFVHAKDLLEIPDSERHRPIPLSSIRRLLIVGRDRPLDELLLAMRKARLHLALVLDAEGRTAGLVTLEDVLEELVGEITDETDR